MSDAPRHRSRTNLYGYPEYLLNTGQSFRHHDQIRRIVFGRRLGLTFCFHEQHPRNRISTFQAGVDAKGTGRYLRTLRRGPCLGSTNFPSGTVAIVFHHPPENRSTARLFPHARRCAAGNRFVLEQSPWRAVGNTTRASDRGKIPIETPVH